VLKFAVYRLTAQLLRTATCVTPDLQLRFKDFRKVPLKQREIQSSDTGIPEDSGLLGRYVVS
jgi:hypothetical protein